MPKSLLGKLRTITVLTTPVTLPTIGAIAGATVIGGLVAPIALGVFGAFAGVSIVGSAFSGMISNKHYTPFQVAGELVTAPAKALANKIKRSFGNDKKQTVITDASQDSTVIAKVETVSAKAPVVVLSRKLRTGFAGTVSAATKAQAKARAKKILKHKKS